MSVQKSQLIKMGLGNSLCYVDWKVAPDGSFWHTLGLCGGTLLAEETVGSAPCNAFINEL